MTSLSTADLLHEAIQAEHRGRFEEARDLLRRAVALGSNDSLSLDAHLRLGKLCLHSGPRHYQEADDVLKAARRQAEQQNSPRQTAAAIHLLALLRYQQRRSLDDALTLLEESPAFRGTGAPGPEVGQRFHYRGLLLAAHGDLANAERLFFRAHQLYQEVHDETGLAEVSDSLANLLLQRGKTRVALRFADLSLQFKRKLHDRYGEAISLGTKGRVYLQQACYNDAREAFTEDLAIAEELRDERGVQG
jgi:tetratricopeptide (TPR) repeat protein